MNTMEIASNSEMSDSEDIDNENLSEENNKDEGRKHRYVGRYLLILQ